MLIYAIITITSTPVFYSIWSEKNRNDGINKKQIGEFYEQKANIPNQA